MTADTPNLSRILAEIGRSVANVNSILILSEYLKPARAELAALKARATSAEADVALLRARVAFFNGAVPTMIQCFDTLVSGLSGNKHSVDHSIKGLRKYVAKLKADKALAALGVVT